MFIRNEKPDTAAQPAVPQPQHAVPAPQPAVPPKGATRTRACSIISADLIVKGTLSSAGDIQLEGRLEGDIRAGGLIFCSGMIPVDPHTGERLHGTLTSEAHVIFGNLKLLLESAGSSLDRLVQVHALIYDSIEYDVLNRVYRQYVAHGPPARTVWSAQIEAGFKIQLDVVAAA